MEKQDNKEEQKTTPKKKVDLLASMAAVESSKKAANKNKPAIKKKTPVVNNSNSKFAEIMALLFKESPKKEKVKFKLTFHNIRLILLGLLIGIVFIVLGFKVNLDITYKAIIVGLGSMIIIGCFIEQRRHLE